MENQINILNMELENYDGDIKDLNEELNSLKNSHSILKKEFSSVIEENKKLSDTLKKVLNTECSLKVKANEDYENVIANLKGRIDELLTEKNTVMKLWQNSAKTIEILEDKARMISLGQDDYMTKPEIEKIKQSYEEKLQQMQQNLISTKEKFHESMKYSAEKRDAQKESDIERSLENQATAFKIVKNLESEILTLQTRLEYTFEQKLMLEKSLMCKDGIVEDLKRKNSEYWTKLTEALRVVEAALNEKDAALQREQEIREEINNLIKKNNETLEEYEARKEKEILLVTNEFEKKHRILLEDLNRIQNEAKNKELEIEEYKRKCILLEQDIKRIENGDKNVSRILELERKMESTFQSLVNSEKQNIQLAAEKLTIKNDIEHMADLYETNIKAKNTEIESYKIKISRLQVELEDKREEVTKVAEKMSVLNQQLNNIETQLGSQRKNSEILNETYTKKIEDLSQAYQLKINDLQAEMENKNEMRDKWKRETNIIVSNLEKLVSNLKDQIHTLKKENKSIKEKCTKLTNKINNYKKFIELISNDVSKLNTAVLEKYDLS